MFEIIEQSSTGNKMKMKASSPTYEVNSNHCQYYCPICSRGSSPATYDKKNQIRGMQNQNTGRHNRPLRNMLYNIDRL